jgi:hypothetical protein
VAVAVVLERGTLDPEAMTEPAITEPNRKMAPLAPKAHRRVTRKGERAGLLSNAAIIRTSLPYRGARHPSRQRTHARFGWG